MFMSITAFQELVTVNIWMFNNLLLNERVDLRHNTNYLTINKKCLIFWNKLILENYGYKPQSLQSLTSKTVSWGAARMWWFSLYWPINQHVEHLVVSDSHDEGKDIIAVFLDFFYNYFDDPGGVHDITCSGGPSSEFKNKFMVKFLQLPNQKHKSLSHRDNLL